jgi:hypothetical protein
MRSTDARCSVALLVPQGEALVLSPIVGALGFPLSQAALSLVMSRAPQQAIVQAIARRVGHHRKGVGWEGEGTGGHQREGDEGTKGLQALDAAEAIGLYRPTRPIPPVPP